MKMRVLEFSAYGEKEHLCYPRWLPKENKKNGGELYLSNNPNWLAQITELVDSFRKY